MADNTIKQSPDRSDSMQGGDRGKTSGSQQGNQTMQHEQAKSSVSGGQSGQREQAGFDKDRNEKSAIGGGENRGEKSGENRGQTGEPGRARSELDQDKSRSETSERR